MADFGDIPLEDIGGDEDVYDDDAIDDVVEETSPVVPPVDDELLERVGGGDVFGEQHLRNLRVAIDAYYTALAKKGELSALPRDTSKFELVRGALRLKDFPRVDIVGSSGKPLALRTVAGKRGGARAIRDGLGFKDWSSKRKLPSVTPKARRELLEVYDEAAAAGLAGTADIDKQVDEIIADISAMDDRLAADISAMDDLIANIPAIDDVDNVDIVDTAAQTIF